MRMSKYTQLESFPNEIFHEIFDYLSLDDLYRSFKDLNQRINDILQSIINRAVRIWSTDENDMNKFFSPTFGFLEINDEYNLNLNQYPNIHSLTYIYATDTQLQHFLQSKFFHSKIKYLNITSDDLSPFIEYLFSHQFPSLDQCILRNIDLYPLLPWRITPVACSISICSNEHLLPFILQSCPNLKRLELSIQQYSNTPSSSIVVHSHLKHLSIEMSEPAWNIETIETLFSSIQVPHLKSFRIRSYQPSIIPFDFHQLIEIFNQHVPNLHRFECDIQLSQGVEIMDLKSIRDLHVFLFTDLNFVYQYNGTLRISTD